MGITEQDQWLIDVGNIGFHSYGCDIKAHNENDVLNLFNRGYSPERAAEELFMDHYGQEIHYDGGY